MQKLRKGEITKNKIIENSLNLFSKNGYHSTSLNNIAKTIGLRDTAILRHFKNKENLFMSVVESILLENVKYLDNNEKKTSSKDQLEAYFLGNLKWANENTEQAQVIIQVYHFACTQERFKQLQKKLIENARKKILDCLIIKSEKSSLKKDKNILKDTASFIHETLIGLILSSITYKKITKKYALKRLNDILKLLEV